MQDFVYWQDMPALKSNLEQVQQIILESTASVKGKLGEAIKYNFEIAGKELRPAFVLLFGQMGKKGKLKRLLKIASSVEILHNATLIHDDIVDDSPIRRGRSSIQYKFGKHIALYAGDYLMALSLQMLANNTSKITNMRVNGKAMNDILAGETAQFGNEYNLDITPEQYLMQIKGKTGILFGYSCFIGAIEGGLSSKKAKLAQNYGELIGEAFQLMDDILDYTASSSQFKKPVLQDVVNGVYSGPLIFAIENDRSGKLHELVRRGKNLSSHDLQRIDQLVSELGGINQAKNLAEDYTNQAKELLTQHFSTYSTYDDLLKLTSDLLDRQL